jgi:hypothetical protein
MPPNRPSGDDAGVTDDVHADPRGIDRREQYVLYCLSEHGRMALGDLADEVTVWETGRRLPQVSAETGRTVYLALYHTHVPRLERADLVTYDPDRDIVGLSPTGRHRPCDQPGQPADGPNRVSPPEDG